MEHHESFFGDPRVWIAIAFLIFFVIFGRKIGTAVNGLLDGRALAIRAELDGAARLRREAEAMLREATLQREAARTEAEAMLADARTRRGAALTDAKALLDGARAEAARLGEQAHVDAQAAGARRERMAIDRIAAAEKAAVSEVRLAAADIAARAASEVIASTLGVDLDAAIIDRAIAGVPAALGRRAA